jgi:hypothetical protein
MSKNAGKKVMLSFSYAFKGQNISGKNGLCAQEKRGKTLEPWCYAQICYTAPA